MPASHIPPPVPLPGDEALRETPLSAETLFAGRVFTARLDRIRLPSGAEATREVVAHRGAVAVVPVASDGRVILVRQWRHAAGRALLEIPAGGLGADEQPSACATRELMEEINLRPGHLTSLGGLFLAPGYSSEYLHLFLAEDLVPEFRASDPDETTLPVHMAWEELADAARSGAIADAKTVAALWLARMVLDSRS